MADPTPSQQKPLKLPELRKQAEEALMAGDLDKARSLAADLNKRKAIGPWEKALLGRIALAVDDLDAAKGAFFNALESDSTHRSALSNLALVHEREGDLDASLQVLERLCGAYENDASFVHRRGQVLLSLGRLSEGWEDYAQRLKNKTYKSWQYALRVPYWAGEGLANKHMVVWTDQGLGEQILTASLLPDVLTRAKKVTLACDPRLCALFQRSFPSLAVVSLEATREKGRDIGPVDVQATLSELGAVLRPERNAFPNPEPFLKPDKDRTAYYRTQIKDGDAPLVGISWRSKNPLAAKEKTTSLSEQWLPVLKTENIRFVSLQYGDSSDDLQALQSAGCTVVQPELDAVRDVDDFAALTAAMDLVISISNTTVHVSGGLGVPTWALLAHAYGRPWYWFAEGDTSPWYAGLNLFRSEGKWPPVFARVAHRLHQWSPG